MSGVTESSALAGRSNSQRPHGNANNSSAALQGAAMAFNTRPPKNPISKNNQSPNGAMKAAVMADRTKRPTPSPNHLSPEAPEEGSVNDKIRKFSADVVSASTRQGEENRNRRLNSGTQTTQMLAATRAAERSASRTPQRPTPARSTSPTKKGVNGGRIPTGDNSNRNGAQSAPTPDRQPQPLPAPIPVRRISSKHIPLADDLDEVSSAWNSRQRTASSGSDPPEIPENSSTRSISPGKVAARGRPTGSILEPTNHPPSRRTSVMSQPSPIPRIDSQRSPGNSHPVSTQRSASLLGGNKPKLPPRPSGQDQTSRASFRDSIDAIPPKKRSDSVSTPSSYPPSISDLASTSTRTAISRNENGAVEERMSKEALADAIVASSLASSRASSRASSPMKVPPPLPPQRRARSRSLLHPGSIKMKGEKRRTPSPPKGLRQTLRDHSKSDDEEKKHGRRHLIRQHPHKHHEGDRRRWRSEITERERKRYEGVWAANKGLWIPPGALRNRGFTEEQDSSRPLALSESDMVVNLVVRDIWSRSRLPAHVLEQIWDLVDHKGIGMLSREEFVVGMWLIDQTLKGHKLPVKVPDSVWESVRHVAGIKLPAEF
jgi:hypothetical protein